MQNQIGMDLGSFCVKYLDHCRLRCVAKTYDNKRRVCVRLLDFLHNLPVDEITPEMIHEYLLRQAKERSNAAYNEDYKHLRAMWSWGESILDLKANPVAKMKRIPSTRLPQYTPSTEDVLRVLAAANPQERVFLVSYLQTGARRSEIFRWTWNDDINFQKREIRLGTRKTRDGSMEYEWLPMSDELYEELWWWWKNRAIRESPYVFPSTHAGNYGKPFTTRRKFMTGMCHRAGVRAFGFHALRRYVASYLADAKKVSAKTIQRILRHKNVTTTERYIQNINRDLTPTMNLLGTKSYQEELPKYEDEVGNGSNTLE